MVALDIADPRTEIGPRQFAYYANCREAIQDDAAPLYRGQPGYRPELDADNDGIACEPYRPR